MLGGDGFRPLLSGDLTSARIFTKLLINEPQTGSILSRFGDLCCIINFSVLFCPLHVLAYLHEIITSFFLIEMDNIVQDYGFHCSIRRLV